MNLPELVQMISDTYNDAEQLWTSVGLPYNEIEQRRASFFETIISDCQQFHQQQQTYQQFILNQIETLSNQAQELATKLNVQVEIPKNSSKQQKCQTLQQLQRIIKSLQEESEKRVGQVLKVTKELQLKSDTCGVAFPSNQLQAMFNCQVAQLQETLAHNPPQLQQITNLNKINTQIDEQIGPMFEQCQKLKENMSFNLNILGRFDLQLYFTQQTDQNVQFAAEVDTSNSNSCQNSLSGSQTIQCQIKINKQNQIMPLMFPTEQQLTLINLVLNNQLQPKSNQFLLTFNESLSQEVETRKEYLKQIRFSLQERQTIIQEVLSVFISEDIQNQKEVQDIFNNIGTISNNISLLLNQGTLTLTDNNIVQLILHVKQLEVLFEQYQLVFIGLLIKQKYTLISKINMKYEQVAKMTFSQIVQNMDAFKKQFNTQEKIKQKLNDLLAEIVEIRSLLNKVLPAHVCISQYQQLQNQQSELKEILNDKSRFTSKGREAVQKRKREDLLRKTITNQYPKTLALLKCLMVRVNDVIGSINININDFQIIIGQHNINNEKATLTDLFGTNYIDQIDIEISKQDTNFVQRYRQFCEKFQKEHQLQQGAMEASQMAKSVGCGIAVIKTPSICKQNSCKQKTPKSNMLRSAMSKSNVENSILANSQTVIKKSVIRRK